MSKLSFDINVECLNKKNKIKFICELCDIVLWGESCCVTCKDKRYGYFEISIIGITTFIYGLMKYHTIGDALELLTLLNIFRRFCFKWGIINDFGEVLRDQSNSSLLYYLFTNILLLIYYIYRTLYLYSIYK